MSQSSRKPKSTDEAAAALFNKHHAVLCNSKLAQSYLVTKNLVHSLGVQNPSCLFYLQTNAYIASIISSRIKPKPVVNADNNKDITVGNEVNEVNEVKEVT